MLDDANFVGQRDPSGSLDSVLHIPKQMTYEIEVQGAIDQTSVPRHVILAGMGGSALAADMIKVLIDSWLQVPVIVVKDYRLPGFVNENSLVIAISHSGNTEETLSCYEQARRLGSKIAALSTGGQLIDNAKNDNIPYVIVPTGAQPRMSVVYHLRGLLKLLEKFNVIDDDLYQQVANAAAWMQTEVSHWAQPVPESENYAKQIAKLAIGKTPVFYAGELTWPLAYKWKISWNESAKNVAFCNQYPEFNHNEFIGWSSHPIEKPFAIFDLRSKLESARIRERMELSDRLLSGSRPKANVIELKGETLLQQLLWGVALADSSSIYAAVLNGVNPAPVLLVEKLKQELS